MNIVEDLIFRRELLDKIAQREFKERTGTHGSDLIFCLNKQALRRLKPLPNTDAEVLLFSLGWATQRWLTGQVEDEPEIEVDGIIVTLDARYPDPISYGYEKVNELMVPWELKATYQSSTKAIEENIHWIRQIMAQCYVTGTAVAYLSRLEIMADWKWIGKFKMKPETIAKLVEELGEDWDAHPTLHAYRFEFTHAELQHFWEWMEQRKEQFEEVLLLGELLPPAVALASGMEWECKFCPYRGIDCRKEEND